MNDVTAKPGPKTQWPGQETVRPTVSLPRNYAEALVTLGNGNMSYGVRRALELAATADTDADWVTILAPNS